MNRNLFNYFLVIFFIGVLAGCNKKDDEVPADTTPPTVSNVRLNDQDPFAVEVVVPPGSELEIDATFADDRELGEYRIDIHNDFDGHDHERTLNEPFEYDETFSLSGTSQTIHKHIDIPANVARGAYHLTIQYFDAAGNEGEMVVIDFQINDPESQPAINIVSPDFNEEIEVEPGDVIVLEGTVSDPDGLDEVHIVLAHEDDHGHEHGRIKHGEPIYEAEYELEGATNWNFENAAPIQIPEDIEHGHYILYIIATDVLGNIGIKTAEVHVD